MSASDIRRIMMFLYSRSVLLHLLFRPMNSSIKFDILNSREDWLSGKSA